LDALIRQQLKPGAPQEGALVDIGTAKEVLHLIERTLVFEENDYQWDFEAHIAAL